MAILKEQSFTPTDAREMHGRISPNEEVLLPPEVEFFLSSMIKNDLNTEAESNSAQTLIDEVEQEALFIEDVMEEQTIARTLLLRFGLPYLPGAENVWELLSQYLADAKEVTEKAKEQLNQTIRQIKALLIFQLTAEQEEELVALKMEEKQHLRGEIILQKTSAALAGEGELLEQKDDAVEQKKKRLIEIAVQKKSIESSIKSMRAMVSNLLLNFANIQKLDSTQLVMV